MPRTSWAEMARYPIVVPTDAVAEVYNECVQKVVERIIASIDASRILSGLRDSLLPKLISGELRVKDAHPIVERAPSMGEAMKHV